MPRYGEVLRSFRVAGRFTARSDWQADLGDFEREVDRDVRTIALDDQGGTGADGEARRPIGEQRGRQARRHKASAVNFPSMARRYRATTFFIAVTETRRTRRIAEGRDRRFKLRLSPSLICIVRGDYFSRRLASPKSETRNVFFLRVSVAKTEVSFFFPRRPGSPEVCARSSKAMC